MELRDKKKLCIKKIIEDYCYNKGDFKIFEFINSLAIKLSIEDYDKLVENIEKLINEFSFALSIHYALFINFNYFENYLDNFKKKNKDEEIFDVIDIDIDKL